MRGKRGISFFAHVVEAPINSIEIQVNVSAMRSVTAHRVLRIAAPHIALHLGRSTAPRPVIVEGRMQGEGVELLHGRILVERVFKFSWSINVFKQHAHSVLWNETAARAALNTNAAVHVESL